MKRTPLVRRTPLRAKTEIKRSGRIRPFNPERKAKQFDRNFGARAEAVREMECIVGHDCQGDIVAAHVKARGMGGCNGSRRDIVPMCWSHHELQGTMGIVSFQIRFKINMPSIARVIASKLDDLGYD